MTRTNLLATTLTLAAGGLAYVHANAQPGKDPTPTTPAVKAPAAAPKADAPAKNPMADMPEYKVLAEEVGTWDVAIKFWLQPGADPSETTCTMTAKMTLGGLFLEQRMTGGKIGGGGPGGPGGMPYETTSLVGYDMGTKKYVATRFSSSAPIPMPSTGTYDAEKRAFTFEGAYKMVYMDVKERDVIRRVSDDEKVVEAYMSFNNSPEWKGIEMTMKRRK